MAEGVGPSESTMRRRFAGERSVRSRSCRRRSAHRSPHNHAVSFRACEKLFGPLGHDQSVLPTHGQEPPWMPHTIAGTRPATTRWPHGAVPEPCLTNPQSKYVVSADVRHAIRAHYPSVVTDGRGHANGNDTNAAARINRGEPLNCTGNVFGDEQFSHDPRSIRHGFSRHPFDLRFRAHRCAAR